LNAWFIKSIKIQKARFWRFALHNKDKKFNFEPKIGWRAKPFFFQLAERAGPPMLMLRRVKFLSLPTRHKQLCCSLPLLATLVTEWAGFEPAVQVITRTTV
jgi:hypothetical protein